MYAVFIGQFPATLHKTYSGALGSYNKLVEETNINPDDLCIKFLMVSDDPEDAEEVTN